MAAREEKEERKDGGHIPPQFEKHIKAEERRGRKKRARGGATDGDGEYEPPETPKRKAGGEVPGEKPMDRMDRRARGGGLADENPTTKAGRVTEPSYAHHVAHTDEGGKRRD